MRKLPPLGSLRAFEAAARRMSFREAATELGVTPTAISHQIRLLEDICGRPLFRRRPRPLVLTGAGERMFPVIRNGFDSFAAAIASASADIRQHPLRVTSPNAFASRWLVPRLPKWREAHPKIPLEIIGTDAVLDLRAGDADVAIRYAHRMPPDLAAQEIVRDTYFAVCSPELLAKGNRRIERAADLLQYPLIHFDWMNPDRESPTWPRWLATALDRSRHPGYQRGVGSKLSRRAACDRCGRRGSRHRDLQRRDGRPRAQERSAGQSACPLPSGLRLLSRVRA